MMILTTPLIALACMSLYTTSKATNQVVDYRYRPADWQTSICLPDDPFKSLVGKDGSLLYHYREGGREFGVSVRVEVVPEAVWKDQRLVSSMVPIVRTIYTAPELEINQEAFSVTDIPHRSAPVDTLERLDSGDFDLGWAKPTGAADPSFQNIAVHRGGAIQYAVHVRRGEGRRIALVLCEGYWGEIGRRVQLLNVEGARPKTVDLIADLGKNVPGVYWFDGKDTNHDGRISIVVKAAKKESDQNSVLNGLLVFGEKQEMDSVSVLSGRMNSTALARMRLVSRERAFPRNDLILVRIRNTGNRAQTVRPQVVVDTPFECRLEADAQRFLVDGFEAVSASLKMKAVQSEGNSRRIELDGLTVEPGQSKTFYVAYNGGGRLECYPTSLEQALSCRKTAESFWKKSALPWGRIQVPDPGIQNLVDSSIRNIWQARERKNGLPVFQVGPTCYRGLWIVDGAFILETATMLGAGSEARNGLAYALSLQKPGGGFAVLSPTFYKENGVMIWACVRHAMLTQDKAWLRSVWSKLLGAAREIKRLRELSPLTGLNPPGEIDGGLGENGTPEFSNAYWNLAGLNALVLGAQWLGRDTDTKTWKAEFDDFYRAFRALVEKNVLRDPNGNRYVPIRVDNVGNELPQRAQWTFCQAVYPGQVFSKGDSLVASTLKMLQDTEREGMVYGTGWMSNGIWTYFASFFGHALLWEGSGQKAADVLYAFANHASPLEVWREEQNLVGESYGKIGDMPHNWASAEFIRLTVHMLALDRGNELHLLEGFLRAWAGPGMVTRLNGVSTPFGRLFMTVKIDKDGRYGTVTVRPLASNCKQIVVHLLDGGIASLSAGEGGTVRFRIDR